MLFFPYLELDVPLCLRLFPTPGPQHNPPRLIHASEICLVLKCSHTLHLAEDGHIGKPQVPSTIRLALHMLQECVAFRYTTFYFSEILFDFNEGPGKVFMDNLMFYLVRGGLPRVARKLPFQVKYSTW